MNWKKAVLGIWAVGVAGFLIELVSLLDGFSRSLREGTVLNYYLSHHYYWFLVHSSEFRDFLVAVVARLILGIVLFLLPRYLLLNGWQKVLVFVLLILIIPTLTMELIVEAVISTSGSGAGAGAAILAWVYGLPIGIILGIILPFVLFAILEKNKRPNKEKIE